MSIIDGAFIQATNIKSRQECFIKLTEIKSIEPYDRICCSFNTYKDYFYYVEISAKQLVDEINYFIFNQKRLPPFSHMS